MCGIVGKLNFDRQEPVDPGLLRRMMEVVSYRGPDGEGEYRQGPVGLGHRRLSIIDLDTGDQPMSNEDGTVWVVYNGEIYNFRELRDELAGLGHKFKSSSDTEVIVHLYEEYGPESVARLLGMFAFALWDERKQLLLLARDRLGIKPLYYADTGRALVFGSELKSVICDPAVARRVNARAIDRFVTYYYVPGPETLLEGILRLEPGHYMTVSGGRVTIKQYWDLKFGVEDGPASFGEAVVSLRGLLRRTVKDHMMSDVPVGVLLSGGVDSTGILRYAVEETGQAIQTFTIGFAGEGFADEREYARLAARQYGTTHREITMSGTDFRDFLPRYVWHMEEAVCEPPAVALYHVTRLARESGVKVVLSGEGGDEAFGGYQTYRNLLLLEQIKAAFGPAKGLMGVGLEVLGRLGLKRIGSYYKVVGPSLSEYYLSRTATPETLFNRLKSALYVPEFRRALDGGEGYPTARLFKHVGRQSLLDQMLYVDTKTWLPEDLLVKADRMTMATSVELRVPLLDSRVLEFGAALPQEFKVRGWSTKRVLKAALSESVPGAILNRKKTGFPVPYERWLRTDLKELVVETVLREGAALRAYFDRKVLDRIVRRFYEGGIGGKEVFCLTVLELWHERFLGNVGT